MCVWVSNCWVQGKTTLVGPNMHQGSSSQRPRRFLVITDAFREHQLKVQIRFYESIILFPWVFFSLTKDLSGRRFFFSLLWRRDQLEYIADPFRGGPILRVMLRIWPQLSSQQQRCHMSKASD